jgi:hypothetical protein
MSARRPKASGGGSDTTDSAGDIEQPSERRVAAHPRRIWKESDFRAPVPEALAAPALVWVRHDEIDGDPFNIREALPSIARLAWSIYQYGLLENLIVVEHPRAQATGKRYELRAGSRRFEAVRRLIEGMEPPPGHPDRERELLWTWPADKPLPALVLGSEGHYEHMVENLERSPPEAWEVGRRVDEILSAGISARDLGTRLGRSNGWVTRYAHIGRGLAPELVAILSREHVELQISELSQLASIRDAYGDPDGAAQIEAYRLRRARRRKRPRRVDPHSFRAVQKRLQYLRCDMPIPPLLRPVVTAVVDYLEGGGRPGFREIETRLFEKIKDFSPDTPEEA